ncbi:MAG: hypothetical protein ACRC0V_12320 [Fusobacteriaceae bacterium]
MSIKHLSTFERGRIEGLGNFGYSARKIAKEYRKEQHNNFKGTEKSKRKLCRRKRTNSLRNK